MKTGRNVFVKPVPGLDWLNQPDVANQVRAEDRNVEKTMAAGKIKL